MTRSQGSTEFWLAGLRTEIADLRVTAAEALQTDPALVVPSCPGWTILDLVRHVAYVYDRVLSHISRGITTDPGLPPITDGIPESHHIPADDAIAFYDERAARLMQTFEALDPDMPAWNWAPQSKKVAFWQRRMALETAVHRWDAQMAMARAEPIEEKMAGDGVCEVLDTWLPTGASRRKGPMDRFGVVHLAAADIQTEWFIRLRGPGIALLDTDTLLDDDSPEERAYAVGPASDILLALFGRIGFDVLEVDGDETLLEALRVG
jgi:uncharacterized protein (TIGR03083 family)